MELQDWVGLGGIPVIVALVQIAKAFVLDDRFHPLLSLAFGIVWNTTLALAMGAVLPEQIARAALIGVVLGLAASGLYSGGRAALGR